MKKLCKTLAIALALTSLALPSTNAHHCEEPFYYVGVLVPYYEFGQQVGVQCVYGGTQCYCIGEIYYY